MSSEAKIPEWAEKAAQDFHDKWDTGMSGAAFRDLVRTLLVAEQRGLEKAAEYAVKFARAGAKDRAEMQDMRMVNLFAQMEAVLPAAIRSLGERA